MSPKTYHLQCDHCHYAVTTVAPARQANGQIVAQLYCPTCGVVREVVAPAPSPRGPLGAALSPRQSQAGRLARQIAAALGQLPQLCPVCADRLILQPLAGHEPRCPHCQQGHLLQK